MKLSNFMPLPATMLMLALLGLVLQSSNIEAFLISINQGFGSSLGYFLIILFPSFLLAESLSYQNAPKLNRFGQIIAPFSGAGMLCPDTSFASLAPLVSKGKLLLAMNCFVGFKLLIPAGPLIISTALGIYNPNFLWVGFILLIPILISNYLFIKYAAPQEVQSSTLTLQSKKYQRNNLALIKLLLPILLLMSLISLGILLQKTLIGSLQWLFHPAGALTVAALFAWLFNVNNDQKKKLMKNAIQRTAELVILIGIASLLAHVLIATINPEAILTIIPKNYDVLILFLLAAIFKTVQGSSMVTFATVTPLVAPIIFETGISPTVAVYSIALGSIITILPNDSFYWLIKKIALPNVSDKKCVVLLASITVFQSLVGLICLYGMKALGLI